MLPLLKDACSWSNKTFHSVEGVTVGLILKSYVPLSTDVDACIRFPGEILYRLLSMVIVPLLMTNVILGKLREDFQTVDGYTSLWRLFKKCLRIFTVCNFFLQLVVVVIWLYCITFASLYVGVTWVCLINNLNLL